MGVINSHLLDEDNRNLEAETVLILCKTCYPGILEIEDSGHDRIVQVIACKI